MSAAVSVLTGGTCGPRVSLRSLTSSVGARAGELGRNRHSQLLPANADARWGYSFRPMAQSIQMPGAGSSGEYTNAGSV
jgi:hypothetical protein